jgi:hypothetical protein
MVSKALIVDVKAKASAGMIFLAAKRQHSIA